MSHQKKSFDFPTIRLESCLDILEINANVVNGMEEAGVRQIYNVSDKLPITASLVPEPKLALSGEKRKFTTVYSPCF